MFSELHSTALFLFSTVVAAGACAGGAYSIYRGLQSLPDGRADVPFFSADPDLITDEGLKWRRRIYACMAYFALSIAIALAIYHRH